MLPHSLMSNELVFRVIFKAWARSCAYSADLLGIENASVVYRVS